MRYENITMDFDGTIAASGIGIINGTKYACETMGFTEGKPWENWRLYIGPTVYRFAQNQLGLSGAEHTRFMDLYKQYYSEVGIKECPLYDGMKELIESLRASGRRVFVCTSKPKALIDLCLVHYGLTFDGVESETEGRVDKPDVIAHCIEVYGLDRKKTAHVGDREGDVEGARLSGIDGIGVTYGYGTREELEHGGATLIVDSVAELEKILKG